MATYAPLVNTVLQYEDSAGVPLSGGTLYFYKSGTTTATNIYSDSTGTSLGTSVTLNSSGYPASGGNIVTLFRDESIALKIILKDSDGTTVWTADELSAVGTFDSDSSDKLAGIEELADVTDAVNVGAVANGKQTRWVPADLMYPTATNGCAALATAETTAGRPDMRVLDFDASSDENAQFSIAFPLRWNLGTVTFRAFWTHASGNTAGMDGVTWALKGVACAADDTIDAAFGTAVSVAVDSAQTAEDLWVSSESAAVTIAGSPGAGELVFFNIARLTDAGDPNKDLDIDARLIGLQIFWTSDALTDD